jgi:D-alanine-D-alanine ligase
MNALIVGQKAQGIDEITMEKQRLSRMVEGLHHGGIDAQHSMVETVSGMKDLLCEFKPDLVFSAAYAARDAQGGRRILNGLFEQEQIAYIGSDEATLALALSKAALKDRWKAANILTPEYFVVRKTPDGVIYGMDTAAGADNFPYILKPSKEGNSRGISQKSIVSDSHALLEGVLAMLSTYDEILIEKYLGEDKHLREFTVAMIGNDRHRLILPCEIVLNRKNGRRVITTADKDEGGTQVFAVEDLVLRQTLASLAEKAFSVAGMRDYARLDVLCSNEQLYAIEINGQPMVPDRWFDACARGVWLDTDQYLNAIFLAGIVRNIQNGHEHLQIPGKMVEILPGNIYRRMSHVEAFENT